MKKNNFFKFSFKKLGLIFLAEILAIVLHNLVSAALGIEEAVFFSLAIFIIPTYLLVVLLMALVNWFKK